MHAVLSGCCCSSGKLGSLSTSIVDAVDDNSLISELPDTPPAAAAKVVAVSEDKEDESESLCSRGTPLSRDVHSSTGSTGSTTSTTASSGRSANSGMQTSREQGGSRKGPPSKVKIGTVLASNASAFQLVRKFTRLEEKIQELYDNFKIQRLLWLGQAIARGQSWQDQTLAATPTHWERALSTRNAQALQQVLTQSSDLICNALKAAAEEVIELGKDKSASSSSRPAASLCCSASSCHSPTLETGTELRRGRSDLTHADTASLCCNEHFILCEADLLPKARPPYLLLVGSPNGQRKCAGDYQLVDGREANGEPLWRHKSGCYWLYSGKNRKWCIGGKDAEETDFNCSKAWIHQTQLHGGLTPDVAVSQFAWFDADLGKFEDDQSIFVIAEEQLRKAVRIIRAPVADLDAESELQHEAEFQKQRHMRMALSTFNLTDLIWFGLVVSGPGRTAV